MFKENRIVFGWASGSGGRSARASQSSSSGSSSGKVGGNYTKRSSGNTTSWGGTSGSGSYGTGPGTSIGGIGGQTGGFSGQSGGGVNASGQRNSSYDSDYEQSIAAAKTPEEREEIRNQALEEINASIDEAVKNGIINADEAALFKDTVRNWDLSKDINIENILTEFKNIKDTTIDPHFAGKIGVFTKDLEDKLAYQKGERLREEEQEGASEKLRIEGAQANLEQSGLTFSGQGINELGGQSAFAQGDKPDAFLKQRQYGGGYAEGRVPMANRLIATSSAARYQKALSGQAVGAEQYLGSEGIGGYNFGSYRPVSGVAGAINDEKDSVYAGTLGQIAGQERQNYQYKQPIDYNF